MEELCPVEELKLSRWLFLIPHVRNHMLGQYVVDIELSIQATINADKGQL